MRFEPGTQLTNRFKQNLLVNRIVNSRGLRSPGRVTSNLQMPSNNGFSSKAGVIGPILTAERSKRLVDLGKGRNQHQRYHNRKAPLIHGRAVLRFQGERLVDPLTLLAQESMLDALVCVTS